MTTDNTQELDELQAMLFKKLPNNWYHHIDIQGVPQASIHKDAVESIMNTILDWHDKQVEAKLAHISEYAENVISIDENGEFSMKAIPLSLVAAERNKLKESK